METKTVAYAARQGLKNESRFVKTIKHLKKDRQRLILFLPCIVFFLLFRYGPMYGLIIAFKKYHPVDGILHSPWVGLQNFEKFFSGNEFFMLLKNTFLLGFYSLVWNFPFPIIFALLLNELRWRKFKKVVQTVSYLPAFLSTVIVCSMVYDFLSLDGGLVNNILVALGMEKHYFMVDPKWFRTIYIASDIWAGCGLGAVIYIAAISNVDVQIYEAGIIDGCNRFRAIWHITLPGISQTIVTLLILSVGNIFSVGFEKVFLLQNPLTLEVSDVFSTYVYRRGLMHHNYSFAAAVGMFESIVSFVMLLIANYASKKINGESLW